MNQEQLVAKTAANISLPNTTVERCLLGLVSTIESSLSEGEMVTIRRFGSLKVTQHKERNSINPRTMESIVTPASNRIKFDASRNLLDKIQGV